MRILNTLLVITAIFSSGLSLAQTKIIVTHPEVPAPTFLDHGKPGQSIGDVRLWHFPAKANDGTNLTTDWIMTTTGVVSDKGVEYRITSAVFSFDDVDRYIPPIYSQHKYYRPTVPRLKYPIQQSVSVSMLARVRLQKAK